MNREIGVERSAVAKKRQNKQSILSMYWELDVSVNL
jgi:hypothetical protein